MQFSRVTAFGPDDGGEPSPDDVEQWHRMRQQPDNEVPVGVPITSVLARTDDLAVVLGSLQLCSSGFGFTLSVRLRQPPAPGTDVYGQVMSNAGAGGQLLLGVQFADGRRGSVLDDLTGWPPRPGPPGQDREVSLTSNGGSGGGRRFDQSWWVTPLPPRGPLLVVVRWDAQGVAERVTEVDGTVVAEAGARAEVLWPWEPERAEAYEPEEATRPTSGWFARSR